MEFSRHLDFLQQLTARAVSGCGLSSWYYAGPLKPVREKLSRDEPVHIHFVCQGNIMRSAFAEAKLRAMLQSKGISGLNISSSGTATNLGKSADPRAKKMAEEFHVSLANHQTTPISSEALASCDLILTMDAAINRFCREHHSQFRDRTLLLGTLLLPRNGPFIRDPYTRDEIFLRECFQNIERSLQNLLVKLGL